MSLNIKTSTGRQILASNGDVLVGGKNYEVYSENETMIGYWTDGKPIYRKVFKYNTQKTLAAQTWLDTNEIIENVENIIETKIFGGIYGVFADVQSSINGGVGIQANHLALFSTEKLYYNNIIFEYTKATDQPVTDTNTYSTIEKLTGETWVNGKPIYRQTIAITVPTATTQGVVVQNAYPLNVNVSEVISLQGMFKNADATSYNTFPRSYQDANNKIGTVILWCNLSNNTLVCENGAIAANGRTGYAIIEYTKQ